MFIYICATTSTYTPLHFIAVFMSAKTWHLSLVLVYFSTISKRFYKQKCTFFLNLLYNYSSAEESASFNWPESWNISEISILSSEVTKYISKFGKTYNFIPDFLNSIPNSRCKTHLGFLHYFMYIKPINTSTLWQAPFFTISFFTGCMVSIWL